MSAPSGLSEVVELTMADLESLLDLAKELGFPAQACQNLEALVHPYALLRQEIGDRDATIEHMCAPTGSSP